VILFLKKLPEGGNHSHRVSARFELLRVRVIGGQLYIEALKIASQDVVKN